MPNPSLMELVSHVAIKDTVLKKIQTALSMVGIKSTGIVNMEDIYPTISIADISQYLSCIASDTELKTIAYNPRPENYPSFANTALYKSLMSIKHMEISLKDICDNPQLALQIKEEIQTAMEQGYIREIKEFHIEGVAAYPEYPMIPIPHIIEITTIPLHFSSYSPIKEATKHRTAVMEDMLIARLAHQAINHQIPHQITTIPSESLSKIFKEKDVYYTKARRTALETIEKFLETTKVFSDIEASLYIAELTTLEDSLKTVPTNLDNLLQNRLLALLECIEEIKSQIQAHTPFKTELSSLKEFLSEIITIPWIARARGSFEKRVDECADILQKWYSSNNDITDKIDSLSILSTMNLNGSREALVEDITDICKQLALLEYLEEIKSKIQCHIQSKSELVMLEKFLSEGIKILWIHNTHSSFEKRVDECADILQKLYSLNQYIIDKIDSLSPLFKMHLKGSKKALVETITDICKKKCTGYEQDRIELFLNYIAESQRAESKIYNSPLAIYKSHTLESKISHLIKFLDEPLWKKCKDLAKLLLEENEYDEATKKETMALKEFFSQINSPVKSSDFLDNAIMALNKFCATMGYPDKAQILNKHQTLLNAKIATLAEKEHIAQTENNIVTKHREELHTSLIIELAAKAATHTKRKENGSPLKKVFTVPNAQETVTTKEQTNATKPKFHLAHVEPFLAELSGGEKFDKDTAFFRTISVIAEYLSILLNKPDAGDINHVKSVIAFIMKYEHDPDKHHCTIDKLVAQRLSLRFILEYQPLSSNGDNFGTLYEEYGNSLFGIKEIYNVCRKQLKPLLMKPQNYDMEYFDSVVDMFKIHMNKLTAIEDLLDKILLEDITLEDGSTEKLFILLRSKYPAVFEYFMLCAPGTAITNMINADTMIDRILEHKLGISILLEITKHQERFDDITIEMVYRCNIENLCKVVEHTKTNREFLTPLFTGTVLHRLCEPAAQHLLNGTMLSYYFFAFIGQRELGLKCAIIASKNENNLDILHNFLKCKIDNVSIGQYIYSRHHDASYANLLQIIYDHYGKEQTDAIGERYTSKPKNLEQEAEHNDEDWAEALAALAHDQQMNDESYVDSVVNGLRSASMTSLPLSGITLSDSMDNDSAILTAQ